MTREDKDKRGLDDVRVSLDFTGRELAALLNAASFGALTLVAAEVNPSPEMLGALLEVVRYTKRELGALGPEAWEALLKRITGMLAEASGGEAKEFHFRYEQKGGTDRRSDTAAKRSDLN